MTQSTDNSVRKVQLSAQFDPPALPLSGGLTHVVVTVQAPVAENLIQRPPLRLALVIDRSGSMAGQPLQLAIESAQLALRLLRQDDEFALIFFSSEAKLAMALGSATPGRVQEALLLCQQVRSGGGTNLAAGWGMGCQQLAVGLAPGGNSLCLLLSDGQANAGESNPARLAEHAAAMRQAGITTSCVGLGSDFDEVLLDGMARAADGRFYFAETPSSLPSIFADEVGDALQVTVPAAVLYVEPGHAAALAGTWAQVSALREVATQVGCAVALGDLTSGQLVAVVLELQMPASEMPVQLDYRVRLLAGEGIEQAACTAPLALTHAAVAKATPRDPQVWRQVVEQRLHRARLQGLLLNSQHREREANQLLLQEVIKLQELSGVLYPQVEDLLAQLRRDAERMMRRLDDMEYKRAYSESVYMSKSRAASGTSLKSLDPNDPRRK